MVQRDEFIERLAAKGYTKTDASVVMDDFIMVLMEALASGESVQFRGFGTFEIRERAAREGVHPQNKNERVVIPAYRTPHFKPGKVLKRAVKDGRIEE